MIELQAPVIRANTRSHTRFAECLSAIRINPNRQDINSNNTLFLFFFCLRRCGISVGIVIPSTWFVYLYKQTVSITLVVMGTKQFSDKTAHRHQYELHLAL